MKSAVNHGVKWSAIVGACYVAFLTNALLSLFFGAAGVGVTASSRARTRLLLENVENLEERQLQLTAKLEALRSDPESVIIEARALGFYRDYEGVIHIQNLESARTVLETGNVLYLKPPRPSNQNTLKIIALAAGLLMLFLSLVNRNFRHAASAE